MLARPNFTIEPSGAHAPPAFSCASGEVEGAVRISPVGELDLATVPSLEQAVFEAGTPGGIVVLDLRGLDFIDCSGVELLIRGHRRIRRDGGRMLVIPGSGMVAWFLELIGADRVLELIARPPAADRSGGGSTGAILDAFARRHPEAIETRETACARLLEAMTGERDALRSRVHNLEQELLELVYQPPTRIAPSAVWRAPST